MRSHRLRAISLAGGLAIVAEAVPAEATCGWFGTQVECSLGAGQVVIGTQVADRPTRGRSAWGQAFHGGGALLPDRARIDPHWLKVQDVGNDPNLCRHIGNETYCY